MPTDALDAPRLRRLIAVGRPLLAELDLETLLQRLVAGARQLTGARHVVLGILAEGRPAVDRPEPVRRSAPSDPGPAFLVVPVVVGGRTWARLHLSGKSDGFDDADEETLGALAEWASGAIATARDINQSRLRDAVESAEQERRRWARELHDETLQALAGLQVRLSIAEQQSPDETTSARVRDVLDDLGLEIRKLRTLITELRPAALDELGLAPALESLVDAITASSDLAIDLQVDLPGERLDPELETAVYRLMQEALTNVLKHADADRCVAEVSAVGDALVIVVRDDGRGIDHVPPEYGDGFGVTGMRERARLAGGSLTLGPGATGGTELRARLPLPHARAGDATNPPSAGTAAPRDARPAPDHARDVPRSTSFSSKDA